MNSPNISNNNLTQIIEQGLILDVHSTIAVRHKIIKDFNLYYLCLFDDEIDGRLDIFSDVVNKIGSFTTNTMQIARYMQLTDAVILVSESGQITILRGGCCNFPLYWNINSNNLHISQSLSSSLKNNPVLNLRGLACSIAVVSLQGPYEPNFSRNTPLADWLRIRRGAVSKFDKQYLVSEEPIQHNIGGFVKCQINENDMLQKLRQALNCYGERQRNNSQYYVEVSGGYDSTIACIGAQQNGCKTTGISVGFPYYEFRYEENIQREVAEYLNLTRTVLDGTKLFPFASSAWKPQLDEPAIAVTGLKNAVEVAQKASSAGARKILVGHGGDQLFSSDLNDIEPVYYKLNRRAFTNTGWGYLSEVMLSLKKGSHWLDRTTGCFVYDARLDMKIKEQYGVVNRTPFTDLEFFECGIMWSTFNTLKANYHDKWILQNAFKDKIPHAISMRKGKAPYDGVWARAYAAHGSDIATELDKVASILNHIGFSTKWLMNRVQQLSNWENVSDREILAAYAIATWLASWDIYEVADVRWQC